MEKSQGRLCDNCGIHIMQSGEFCPLCGSALHLPGQLKPGLPQDRIFPKTQSLPSKEGAFARRLLYSLVVLGGMLIPALIVLIVDLQSAGAWTWSKYVHVSIAYVSMGVVGTILAGSRQWLILFLWLVFSLAFIVLVEMITPVKGWAVGLAIPIILGAFLTAALGMISAQVFHSEGLVALGIACVLISLFCLGIELQLGFFLENQPHLVWSPIVASVLIPLGAVFGIIRVLMLNSTRIQRFFHW